MEINLLKPADVVPVYYIKNDSNQLQSEENPNKPSDDFYAKAAEPNVDNLEGSIDKMSKAMEALNADIRFTLHEGTGRLIVQVVNITNDEVIKEFPPKEFLDTQAKIKEYIGLLLDLKG